MSDDEKMRPDDDMAPVLHCEWRAINRLFGDRLDRCGERLEAIEESGVVTWDALRRQTDEAFRWRGNSSVQHETLLVLLRVFGATEHIPAMPAELFERELRTVLGWKAGESTLETARRVMNSHHQWETRAVMAEIDRDEMRRAAKVLREEPFDEEGMWQLRGILGWATGETTVGAANRLAEGFARVAKERDEAHSEIAKLKAERNHLAARCARHDDVALLHAGPDCERPSCERVREELADCRTLNKELVQILSPGHEPTVDLAEAARNLRRALDGALDELTISRGRYDEICAANDKTLKERDEIQYRNDIRVGMFMAAREALDALDMAAREAFGALDMAEPIDAVFRRVAKGWAEALKDRDDVIAMSNRNAQLAGSLERQCAASQADARAAHSALRDLKRRLGVLGETELATLDNESTVRSVETTIERFRELFKDNDLLRKDCKALESAQMSLIKERDNALERLANLRCDGTCCERVKCERDELSTKVDDLERANASLEAEINAIARLTRAGQDEDVVLAVERTIADLASVAKERDDWHVKHDAVLGDYHNLRGRIEGTMLAHHTDARQP